MKRFIRYIKTHPFDATLWGIIIVGFLLTAYFLLSVFFPSNQNQLFGNRLSGINTVKITNKELSAKEEKLTTAGIKNVNITINGKIINVVVNSLAPLDDKAINNLADATIKLFNKQELAFYDLQLIIAVYKKPEVEPIFGYKNANSNVFSWTKNKGVTS